MESRARLRKWPQSYSHGHHPQQLALVVFFLGALAHLPKCAQANRHTLQLALYGGGSCGGIYMWWLAIYYIFQYFTQSTIELGAQEAWPINVLPRWLKVTWHNIK